MEVVRGSKQLRDCPKLNELFFSKKEVLHGEQGLFTESGEATEELQNQNDLAAGATATGNIGSDISGANKQTEPTENIVPKTQIISKTSQQPVDKKTITTDEEEAVFCDNCGTKLKPGKLYCGKCGKKIS